MAKDKHKYINKGNTDKCKGNADNCKGNLYKHKQGKTI